MPLVITVFGLLACNQEKELLEPSQENIVTDADGDGFDDSEDCDDTDDAVYPEPAET